MHPAGPNPASVADREHLPLGGRVGEGAVQLTIGGARGRSEAEPTDLKFRSECTCDPQGRVHEDRTPYICRNRCV